jgi:hypothetical protein
MKNKLGLIIEGKVVENIHDEKRNEKITRMNKESDNNGKN